MSEQEITQPAPLQPTQQLIDSISRLTEKLHSLSHIFSQISPTVIPDTSALDQSIAFRWEKTDGLLQSSGFIPLLHPKLIGFSELCHVDKQKLKIRQNTEQFVQGFFANNVLLTGARGTGKSSLIKACLNEFHSQGLRVIEVEKKHLNDLPRIVAAINNRPEKFIIFCDDLSFEEGDTSYSGLKTVLDGSIAGPSSNVLIYATSNRKHLITEKNRDNLEFNQGADGEIHPGDTIEEKVSLADRFGLHLNFYSFSQQEYLNTVHAWLSRFGWTDDDIAAQEKLALQWATQKGNRSGRAAVQFAKQIAGQRMVEQGKQTA
ncbi:ATP-binding protein [Alkanindiges sp. WGS2144]|uniref:ATP-binding protein n=1 Tax=Alkanindiges sp. WGS2144 TaxID=3366808 RepID=UPI003750BF23